LLTGRYPLIIFILRFHLPDIYSALNEIEKKTGSPRHPSKLQSTFQNESLRQGIPMRISDPPGKVLCIGEISCEGLFKTTLARSHEGPHALNAICAPYEFRPVVRSEGLLFPHHSKICSQEHETDSLDGQDLDAKTVFICVTLTPVRRNAMTPVIFCTEGMIVVACEMQANEYVMIARPPYRLHWRGETDHAPI
jgi:hypothetical protein